MQIEHPPWARALLLPFILFVIVLALLPAVCLLYWAAMSAAFAGGSRIPSVFLLVLAPLHLLLLFIAWKALPLYRFRHVWLDILENGSIMRFSTMRGHRDLRSAAVRFETCDWFHVIRFFEKDGEELAAFDYLYPGCPQIVKWARENLG